MNTTRLLRLTMALGAAAIPFGLWNSEAAALIGFFLVTIWVNGPVSFLFPATFEPLLMLVGRVFEPLVIATVATAGTIVVEHVNLHLYRQILHTDQVLARTRGVCFQRLATGFRTSPFLIVWICSLALPYWPVRILGPMSRYPHRRQLIATALGRFPRWWFFADLGTRWHIDMRVLGLIPIAGALLGIAIYAIRTVNSRIKT